MENDWLGTDRLMVVRDNWLEQEQMHLDTYFNCIDRDLVTLSANRYKAGPDSSQYLTVDVYERKNGRYSRTVEGACFVDFLEKTLGVKVIPISRPDEPELRQQLPDHRPAPHHGRRRTVAGACSRRWRRTASM